MKKLVFFGLLAMFAINAVALDDDNLVTNPSFESTGKGKLKKLKQITVAENWESPTGLNADLFDKSRAQPCSAPNNIYGKEFYEQVISILSKKLLGLSFVFFVITFSILLTSI